MRTLHRHLSIAAALVSLLAGCGGSGEASAPVLFQWEDYVDAPFLEAYRRSFGETPRTAIFADEDEAFSKLRAGFKPDVMGPCYYEFPRWRDAGLLAPIDTRNLKTGRRFRSPYGNCRALQSDRARYGSCRIIGAIRA